MESRVATGEQRIISGGSKQVFSILYSIQEEAMRRLVRACLRWKRETDLGDDKDNDKHNDKDTDKDTEKDNDKDDGKDNGKDRDNDNDGSDDNIGGL